MQQKGSKEMKWFMNTFLPSFKDGETRISEKQFNIFCRYCKNVYERGFTEYHETIIAGRKIRAYEWACITGVQYYVIIERDNEKRR